MTRAPFAFAVLSSSLALLCLAPRAGAQSTVYGTGTAGQGGFVPALRSGDPAIGNTSFSLDVSQGLGGAPALLAFSLGAASLPLPGGTILLVDPFSPQLLFTAGFVLGGTSGGPGTGTGSFPLPLAANLPRELIGAAVYAQALLGDVGPGGRLSATNGLEVRLRHEPLVFVGLSVGGTSDPYYVIEARGFTMRTSSNNTFTDNVTDARFAPGGRYVYVGSSLGNGVHRGDLATANPQWTPYYAAGGACYGVEIDAPRQRLYTLAGASASSSELVAVDVDPTSATYGQPLGSSLGISGGSYIERWALAPSGDFALILTLFSDLVLRVDTNPASPTYLQNTGTFPLPPSTSVFRIANKVVITPGDRFALVLIQNAGAAPGEMHRLDLLSGTWIDHDLATVVIDPLGVSSVPPIGFGSAPHGLALSKDGSFAIVTGWANSGFAGRLNLDPQNPGVYSWVGFNPGVTLEGAWACDLSRDDASVYVGTFPTNPELHRLDAQTGALLGSVALPGASNVYTVRTN